MYYRGNLMIILSVFGMCLGIAITAVATSTTWYLYLVAGAFLGCKEPGFLIQIFNIFGNQFPQTKLVAVNSGTLFLNRIKSCSLPIHFCNYDCWHVLSGSCCAFHWNSCHYCSDWALWVGLGDSALPSQREATGRRKWFIWKRKSALTESNRRYGSILASDPSPWIFRINNEACNTNQACLHDIPWHIDTCDTCQAYRKSSPASPPNLHHVSGLD